MSIEYIPREFWTPRLCRYAVLRDPGAISEVPIGLLDDETILRAVVQQPNLISFLPDSRKTKRLCEIAILIDPDLIHEVPQTRTDYHIRTRAFRDKAEKGIGNEAYSAASRAFDIAKLRNSVDRWFTRSGAK
jgi:hypothetical protein